MLYSLLIAATIQICYGQGSAQGSTTLSAQMFCDNYCKVYYNGELVFNDASRGRTVDEFEFDAVKTGTRTIAVWLADNPYDSNEGIWNFESPTFLDGQTDGNGDAIVRQYCLGDGGFRLILQDDKCEEEVIVSNGDWKCESVITGPRDISACFPNWDTDHTPVTMGGPNDKFILYDPCIRSSDASFAPDNDNCDCTQDFTEDYVNWATEWYQTGFDDSNWAAATTFTEIEAVPKLGRSATQTLDECNPGQYCYTTAESWGNSEFIWSDAIELDNLVLCRYEYESTCN